MRRRNLAQMVKRDQEKWLSMLDARKPRLKHICDICNKEFKSHHSVKVHKGRMHGN